MYSRIAKFTLILIFFFRIIWVQAYTIDRAEIKIKIEKKDQYFQVFEHLAWQSLAMKFNFIRTNWPSSCQELRNSGVQIEVLYTERGSGKTKWSSLREGIEGCEGLASRMAHLDDHNDLVKKRAPASLKKSLKEAKNQYVTILLSRP